MIRPATSSDAAVAIAALLTEFSEDSPVSPEALLDCAQDLMNGQTYLGFAVDDHHGLAGLVMINECAAIYAGGLFGEISELWVRKDCRSKGIAADLVAHVKRFARDRGWKRLEVGAPLQPQWARTLAFYEREGFATTGPRLRLIL